MLLHGGYNDGPDEVEVKLKSNHLGSGLSTVTNDWISWASLSLLAPGVSSGPSKCEEDRPFHRRCHCDSRNDIWNMLMREFFPKMIIPPILGLWLTLLLTLEVKKKKEKYSIQNPGVAFALRIYKSICPGRMPMITQWTNHYSPAKTIPLQIQLGYFYFLCSCFLYALDSAPYREWFSEAITETGPSDGIGSDWDNLR